MGDVRHLGQAGVYRVASELSLRGLEVYFPSVDVGIDLLTGTGKRIQIKTATLRERKQGRAYYIGFGWNQAGTKRRAKRRARSYSEEVDVVVIWGVDNNRFWIVPANVFDNHSCLMLREDKTAAPYERSGGFCQDVYKYENRWDLITG